MKLQTLLLLSSAFAGSFVGPTHAALVGRDLNGSAGTFEAYYDTVLDVTWLADANFAQTSGYDADGRMTWQEANAWAANLSFTNGSKVYDNWRLPTVMPINGVALNPGFSTDGSTDGGYNVSAPGSVFEHNVGGEMAFMFYNNLGNPGYFTVGGQWSGCYVSSSNTCLDNTGPFQNLQAGIYWTDLEYAPNKVNGWAFGMNDGNQYAGNFKGNGYYAWAVTSGDIAAAVPEADAWAMMLVGLGLVGYMGARRRAG